MISLEWAVVTAMLTSTPGVMILLFLGAFACVTLHHLVTKRAKRHE